MNKLRLLGLVLFVLAACNSAFFFDFEVYTTDILVIGTGPGGSTFAGTIASGKPNKEILMIDKGPKVSSISDPDSIRDATRYLELTSNPDIELGYFTTPQIYAGGVSVSLSRAGVLGGCDAHNGLVYRLPVCEVYEKYQIEGFNCSVMEKHRNLTLQKLTIVQSPAVPTKAQNDTIQTLMNLGVPFVSDEESASWSKPGVQRTWHTMKYVNSTYNERITAFDAFVKTNPRYTSPYGNLKVKDSIHIEQIIFFNKRAVLAIGKNVKNDKRVFITIKDDLVLAGGTYDTPALLQASGVGDFEFLESEGLPKVHHSPGVGNNLHYHAVVPLLWIVNPEYDQAGPLQRFESMVAVYTAREASGASGAIYDIFQGFVPATDNSPGVGITVVLSLRDFGPGYVRYNKTNPSKPVIEWNLYKNVTELQHMIDIFKLARNYTQALPAYLMEYYPGTLIPSQTDEEIANFVKFGIADGSHPAATMRMCNDPITCPVDHNYRVRGLQNVYVSDTSVLPEVGGANTKAITILVGSMAAERYLANN